MSEVYPNRSHLAWTRSSTLLPSPESVVGIHWCVRRFFLSPIWSPCLYRRQHLHITFQPNPPSMQVDETWHDHLAADIYHPLRFARVDVRCNLGDLSLRHGDIKPASQALTWIEYLSTLDE